jgi:hypothetical protein
MHVQAQVNGANGASTWDDNDEAAAVHRLMRAVDALLLLSAEELL